MPIAHHFVHTTTPGAGVSWTLVSLNVGLNAVQSLARETADEIVSYICSGSPHLHAVWRAKAFAGTALPPAAGAALADYLSPAFGLPGDPSKPPPDHRQGFIAQMLWYLITRETVPEYLIHLEDVATSATEPGGDGFALHDDPAFGLRFRLWEIKKKTGGSRISGAIGNAYSQLKARAGVYLAKYTRLANQQPTPARQALYARLVELWQQGAHAAAAGVAVSTSQGNMPRRGSPFSRFPRKFPSLAAPDRLRGMLAAVPDLEALADEVRAVVWTGL
jgi:hypothetical protein